MKPISKLAYGEKMFTEIVWAHEPLPSSELARLAEQAFGWKRTTTYTVLKRLQDRGFLVNENGIVRSLISREDYQSAIGNAFLQESFEGSLPSFVAAFTSKNKLTEEEIHELRRLIDSCDS